MLLSWIIAFFVRWTHDLVVPCVQTVFLKIDSFSLAYLVCRSSVLEWTKFNDKYTLLISSCGSCFRHFNSIFLLNRLQMDDWHTYTYCVAWWHQIWGCGSSWGAKRVLRCTTLKVLNEFYDVPRSKLWRLKFCNKIYVWVHDQ